MVSVEGVVVVGGVLIGVLFGLLVDLMVGGLMFGVGVLVGVIFGVFGGVGLVKGYNVIVSKEGLMVCWSNEVLICFFEELLLFYLVVVYFGWGCGEWSRGEYLVYW